MRQITHGATCTGRFWRPESQTRLPFENRNIPSICDLRRLRLVVAKMLVSGRKSGNFAVMMTDFPCFVLLGKLSFVYESKEKMSHKQHKCLKKISLPKTDFIADYQLLILECATCPDLLSFLDHSSSLTYRCLREPTLSTVLRRID
jgi:hypothetical protein